MDVHIHKAGKHELPSNVHNRGSRRRSQRRPDRSDFTLIDQYVRRANEPARIYHRPALDENSHDLICS
jgi:hypothetical protein